MTKDGDLALHSNIFIIHAENAVVFITKLPTRKLQPFHMHMTIS